MILSVRLPHLVCVACSALGLVPDRAVAANAQVPSASTQSPPAQYLAEHRTDTQQKKKNAEPAKETPLGIRTTLNVKAQSLRTVLDLLGARTGVRIVYGEDVGKSAHLVTCNERNATVQQLLNEILAGSGFRYRVTPTGHIMISRDLPREGDSTTRTSNLTGRIIDSSGRAPLANVLVTIAGTSLRAVSDARGAFTIANVPPGAYTLSIRLLGYAGSNRTVTVPPGETAQPIRLDIVMTQAATRLNEVVTTATGPQRRIELGNTITTLRVPEIMEKAPVTSVTDLLEGRVPGLQVLRTSGAPGDPARIRLRGAASISQNNDPIVIVDGVRIYAEQSEIRSGNLADTWQKPDGTEAIGTAAAPSPIDQIDPHSIETIEVFKGPSAATLYGADAANGVIVITTKRGRATPPRWSLSLRQGDTWIPGEYAEGYYRLGHSLFNEDMMLCLITNLTCVSDSTRRFQALNNPRYSPLQHGNQTGVTIGVSGGLNTLQYSLTGSYSAETGVLRLPPYEVERFQELRSSTPPGWMRRPLQVSGWNLSARTSAQMSPTVEVAITSNLGRKSQQRSTLESQMMAMMTTYIDEPAGKFYHGQVNGLVDPDASTYLTGYFRRLTATSADVTNALSLDWQARPWFKAFVQAGLNSSARVDDMWLPRGMATGSDSTGAASTGRGSTQVGTVNLRGMLAVPVLGSAQLRTSIGANYVNSRIADLVSSATDLPVGVESFSRGVANLYSFENKRTRIGLGWYVEPTLSFGHLFLSTGLRFDGGNTWGTQTSLIAFPKVSMSWILSEESFFPSLPFLNVVRVRAAYGQAGLQPGARDKSRIYAPSRRWVEGSMANVLTVTSIGNTVLGPERSTEIEGGIDVDLLDNRLSFEVTGYRKVLVDALVQMTAPPSVFGNTSVTRNIGEVLNTGVEASLTTTLVRSDPMTLDLQTSFSRNTNEVIDLGYGVRAFSRGQSRIVEGYPLFGRWARPVMGFVDANGDNRITADEVQVGDSAVYMGGTLPDYNATFQGTLSLFRGVVGISAAATYQSGLTQTNRTVALNRVFSRALNDTLTPLGEQAAIAAMGRTDYGLIQTISAFRLNSVSVTYQVPSQITRQLRARALSLALQGSNLGLRTNYRGKDPNVNAYSTGNDVADAGTLPQPRTWTLRANLNY